LRYFHQTFIKLLKQTNKRSSYVEHRLVLRFTRSK